MEQSDYCFIVNPGANGGAAGRRWPALEQQLLAAGVSLCCHTSQFRGHGKELARRALAQGYRKFVAVGGDGTANEVLNGLLPAGAHAAPDIALGLIPLGTGNDWARYYGLSADASQCADLLLSGVSRVQDIGRVSFSGDSGEQEKRYFLNCAGIGFDSHLLQEMDSRRGGRFRYLMSVVKSLGRYQCADLHIETDDERLDGPVLMLDICLGKYAGGGMRFAPSALNNNGQFDVLLVRDVNRLELMLSLLYLYNGKIRSHPAVKYWQSTSLAVAAEPGQFFHCDGELVGQLPVNVEILPECLRVLAA